MTKIAPPLPFEDNVLRRLLIGPVFVSEGTEPALFSSNVVLVNTPTLSVSIATAPPFQALLQIEENFVSKIVKFGRLQFGQNQEYTCFRQNYNVCRTRLNKQSASHHPKQDPNPIDFLRSERLRLWQSIDPEIWHPLKAGH